MRLIEFTEEEPVKIGKRAYPKGSRDYFEDDEGAEIIELGWGFDVDTGEKGERKPGAVQLKVETLAQKVG